ncbi:MAG: PAS domain S-box protein [Deltaproteobacteria bacterium]|nr:PAS domain S-box protein [Deltaproteobacteria bacterium]
MPKIMIADDDITVQMELEEYLNEMKHEVVGIAGRSDAAVEMALALKPDLILMDVNMPGEMDGISAARSIKGKIDVAVVFVTGYGDPECIERAKQVEPFGYVMKPFDDTEINAVIEIGLYKKELESKLKLAHRRMERTNLSLHREIEIRRKTERVMKENEEKYRSLFENAPVGIGIADEKGNILDFNDAILLPGGYNRQDITEMGNLKNLYYRRDVRERVLKKAFEQGFLDEEPLQFKRKDGTPYDALLSLRPIRIERKNCWQAIVQDVTEKRKAQEKLEQAHREWESIFQSIGHPTMVLNGDQKIIHVNRATEEKAGVPEKDMIGKRCYEIFHNSDRPPEGCPFQRMTASAHLESGEMEALKGSFSVSCTPMLDASGRIEKVIHIATDVTERRRLDEKREETLSQLRATLEATVDGIIVVSLDQSVSAYSRRFMKIWRIEGSLLDSGDANQVLDYVLDQLTEPEVFSIKVRTAFVDPGLNTFDKLFLKDGRIFEVYSRPQKLDGHMIGRVWSFRDVTEAQRARMGRQLS